MPFIDPHTQPIEEALARADVTRARLADAIATADEATARRAKHYTDAIIALIPRFTDPDPEEGP
jgi:hypothetical protein